MHKKYLLLILCLICGNCLLRNAQSEQHDQQSLLPEIQTNDFRIHSTLATTNAKRTTILSSRQLFSERNKNSASADNSENEINEQKPSFSTSEKCVTGFLIALSVIACICAGMRMFLAHSFSSTAFLAMMKKSFFIKKHSSPGMIIIEFVIPISVALLMLFGLLSPNAQMVLGYQISTFTIIIFIIPISQMIKNITEERDSGIKEAFQIMGMKRWLATGTWAIFYTIVLSLYALIFSAATSIGTNVNFGRALLFNLLCGFSTIAFSLFITAFFTKPIAAGIVTPVVLLGLTAFVSISAYPENGMYVKELSWAKYMCCIDPFSVYMWGSYSYLKLGYGLEHPGFILTDSPCLVQALLTVVYSILAWYVERVIPSSKESYYPPYFLFTKEYWGKENPIKKMTDADDAELGTDVEPPLEGSVPIIKIRNLLKVFKKNKVKFSAVDHLNLTMYDNQVFCLLGHNGAGKTTAMSILTGQLRADGGDVFVDGYSITSQQDAARKSMGICPQNNILYKTLSVWEHVELVAALKNIEKSTRRQEVANIITQVGLDEQKNKNAGTLSGGMKRKLCLAMAFVGNPKVVILDEPTAGMDPQSRHKIWDFVQSIKQNKTIILTTHYMDEADILGDRIAVVSSGQLKCVGTSLFLKQRFGVGYILTIEKNQTINTDWNMLLTKFQEFAPSITKADESVHCITFHIPLIETPKLPQLFKYIDSIAAEDELDTHKPIQDYGVSMTTLEQVFINLAETDEEKQNQNKDEIISINNEAIASTAEMNQEDHIVVHSDQTLDWNVKYSNNRQLQHFCAFVIKRFACFLRNWVAIFISIISPTIYTITMVSICGSGKHSDGSFGMLLPYIVQAFNFIPACSIDFLIYERVCKSKRLQQMCGVSMKVFWLGNIIFDTLFFIIGVAVLFLSGFIFKNLFFLANPQQAFALLVLLFAYWYPAIGFSYLISLVIDSPAIGQSLVLFVHFALGLIPFIAVTLLKFFISENTVHLIVTFLRFIPGFSLTEGGFNIGTTIEDYDSEYQLWSWNCITGNVVTLLITGTIFFIILAQKESRFIGSMVSKFCSLFKSKSHRMNDEKQSLLDLESDRNNATSSDSNIDVDVLNEQNLVEELVKSDGFGSQYPVVLHRLSKTFPKTRKTPKVHAVNNLSLGVPNGECFGLLGVNGAGKTTTLSILTKDIKPTSGDAFMRGEPINGDLFGRNVVVGYCPQFDPLIPKMTVREHLALFGKLRGVPPERLNDTVNSIINQVGLQSSADIYSKNLSGGMKRKLSLSIALIGSPEIIYLDEPSTGLDPLASHHSWGLIKAASAGKSIVFTTHSMEECEALSTRVGIMAHGQFYCLGSVQHLKNKFGGSYFVEAKAQHGRAEDVKAFIDKEFHSAKLEEQRNELLKFSIPRANTRIGTVFEKVETNKEQAGIATYSVRQTTLEEVFISVANANADEP